MKNTYVSQFLKIKCAGDVLNICNPIDRAEKEISETYSMIRKIKRIVLNKKMKYVLYDFCAGNALTSVLSVFLLPVKKAVAIDRRPRKRNWHLVKRFEYIFENIFDFDPKNIESPSIIIGVHSCGILAKRIIEIYNNSMAKYLLLMPCCEKWRGENSTLPTAIIEALDSSLRWSYHLTTKIKNSYVNIVKDRYCLSAQNNIIIARKRGG